MAKVYITCGKICAGKSSYARYLCEQHGAVRLSVDEIMLTLFGQNAGKKHDEYVKKLEDYLYDKAVELARLGISSVLDIGLWTKDERDSAREYFSLNDVECEIHYLAVSDEEQRRRINRRNLMIKKSGENDNYLVNDDLAAKCDLIFEEPAEDEAVVWVEFGRSEK